MSLVFRTDQTTPLTNDQVDNNFKYLRDQINAKYSTSDFTAANISLTLRTPVSTESSLQLAQSNAINAWTIRDLVPSSTLPVTTNKSSLVSRDNSGSITVSTVYGTLTGNADSATSATTATRLATSRTINGVSFDGSSNITVADSTKLPLTGGTLTGKLNLAVSQGPIASINFGSSSTAPDVENRVNGDMWATTSGVFYHIQGQTDQVAPIASPTFTGIPRAPGYSGTADQIITLSHLNNATTTLNNSIALKANIASPTFTGTPSAPTASAGTNTTQISTTAFVKTAVDSKATDITTAYKAYTDNAVVAYSNTVNTLLAAKAALASPQFTGTPTAPTAASGNNSLQIANTAFTTLAFNTLQNSLNSAVSALNDAISSTRPVPVGAVFYMSGSAVPYGYFEANGQAVSQTTYADLWNYYGRPATTAGDAAGTFRIPDLRGEFIRGWDHGRGIDTNRILGTVQYGSIESHTHTYSDTYYREAWGSGNGPGIGSRSTDNDNYDYNYIKTTDATGGNETRPRNVALMPIIKW